MQTNRTLALGEIPGQSELFREYLVWSQSAAFYQRSPHLGDLETFAREDLPLLTFARQRLIEILREQNLAYGSDIEPIRELEKPDCVAILTGQQVGLMTGPLYTIYKALTAIRLAKELRTRGVPAVPIFWMDTDDHDLAEVCRIATIAPDSLIRISDCREALFGKTERAPQAIGSVTLPDSIRGVIADYLADLPSSESASSIRQLLDSTQTPGTTFSLAFAKLMARLFRGMGLILFDPRDVNAKRLAAPVFGKALADSRDITARLAERSFALQKAGYHAQVHVAENSTTLFLEVQGERRSLTAAGRGFAPKNTDSSLSLEEILAFLDAEPERFSPNVLLRPIIQDHLFPTAAYVGGPSEIAYFAQIEVLYQHFGRPMPVIWPRAAFTLLDADVRAAMVRYGIEIEDCWHGRKAVLEKFLRQSPEPQLADGVQSLRDHLAAKLDGIRPSVVSVDPTLGPALDNSKRKILHQFDSLQARLIQYEARKNSQLEQTCNAVLSACYPNNNLQERELGIWPFLARGGFSLLDGLLSRISLDQFVHQVITFP